jgi:hypothetical protein
MLNKNLNKLKIVHLSIQNKLPILLGKIYTKPNFNKILIIFIVGFISRILINYIYNVNIFVDFFNKIFVTYLSFSMFIILVNEIFDYFYMTLDVNSSFKSDTKFKIPIIFEMKTDNPDLPNPRAPSNNTGTSVNPNSNNNTGTNVNPNSIEPESSRERHNRLRREEALRVRESKREASRLRKEEVKRLKEERLEFGRQREQERRMEKGSNLGNRLRREEINLRREEATRIAEERLRSGLMMGGEINFDANSSSQIGSNKIRDDERRYQESLELPPILDFESPTRSIPSRIESLDNNNSSVMVSPVTNNYQGNKSTNNNPDNNYTYNNEEKTK